MRLQRVLLLPLELTAAQVLGRLANTPGSTVVLLVRSASYFAFDADTVRTAAAAADPSSSLAALVSLEESSAAPVTTPSEAKWAAPGAVVLDGSRVLGILISTEVGRGVGAGVSLIDAPVFAEPPSEPPPGTAVFRAFPDITAPGKVAPLQRFSVSVGFAADGGPGAQPVLVAHAAATLDFVVQIAGFGFSYPDGIRRALRVTRDAPTERVAFTVVADAAEADRVIEVSWELAGVVVGRAWAEVSVQPGATEAAPAETGGSGLEVGQDAPDGPHLTVDIRNHQAQSQLEWVFHCRYADVALPQTQVTSDLGSDSAETFATNLMAAAPATKGSPLLPGMMRGAGQKIRDVVPPELLLVLVETWQRAAAVGEVPSLLLNTDEPWVPWELMWAEVEAKDGWVPTGLLTEGGFLGALWDIGRWVSPQTGGARRSRPPSPPTDTVEVHQFACVTGHYASNKLAGAEQEGLDLAATYGAVPVEADEADIAALLDGTLVKDGIAVTPDVLHVAAHGEVDPGSTQFTGIVLTSGRHLDPLLLRSAEVIRTKRPFVFMNACQVGTAGTILSDYGGLAGSLVVQGARGFVAPLWFVDDDRAHDIALEVYRRTLGEGQTVGAALRAVRSGFDGTTSTPLAYVFYGNPSLRLIPQPKAG